MDERGVGLDLHLDVPRGAGAGRAIEIALREAVRSGRLPAGARLPGSRSLAVDLGVSRGTVVQVYGQLIAEGWLTGEPGSGTWVADIQVADAGPRTEPRVSRPDPEFDLQPGRPDLSSFPRAMWASAVRRAAASAEPAAWDYGEPAGLPVLRSTIARYVARTRGVAADAESVVVTAGFANGLALVGRALRSLGVRCVATEDPGLPQHRWLLRAAGMDVVPLSVGADGADPAGLTEHVGAALLTPAHQYPRGVVLAPVVRAGFVAWARRRDGFLVEDDYDGEFRYDRQPVGAVQALAPDRVVYAGSASKSLSPGMRLGWLVVPPTLREAVLAAVAETGTAVPAFHQLAFADLVERGDYDRHIRRARLVYRRRRTELAERLAAPLDGVAAGLHALMPVGSAEEEGRLVDTGRYAGLHLHGLHTEGYWHKPAGERPAGLILGFATPPPHTWKRALEALAELVDAVTG
ncbi:PLP-dependent aminotransferase family protein [Actinomadura sp. NEAU-AAG7]|uniref:MocR-like pyridoxine biosynthesis transcription factor PdxR n=1 Tax=Actinomadura sp. NEAU-AAG7 TaxID=2839640 RepID=UPI001BE3DC38|nr:PLP-dependent aminotransferase family protein [Actinomadura sp. NEAU-AAG7]MBT2207089.1 PLP-dependent aminotransferase family protein [Actinomadura sp. NEAU-AAG7]